MTTATCSKADRKRKQRKTAGQSFKKSVIIEGFADRSEDGKKTKARLEKAAGVDCRIVKNIQPISVGV